MPGTPKHLSLSHTVSAAFRTETSKREVPLIVLFVDQHAVVVNSVKDNNLVIVKRRLEGRNRNLEKTYGNWKFSKKEEIKSSHK